MAVHLRSASKWQVPRRLLTVAVIVWFLIAAGANVPGAAKTIPLLFGPGRLADVVAAGVALAFLLSSLLIWFAALAHFHVNQRLLGRSRAAWTVAVYGLFVFGALAYYFAHMRGRTQAAA